MPLAVLLVAGCGGDAGQRPQPAPSTGPQPATAPSPAPAQAQASPDAPPAWVAEPTIGGVFGAVGTVSCPGAVTSEVRALATTAGREALAKACGDVARRALLAHLGPAAGNDAIAADLGRPIGAAQANRVLLHGVVKAGWRDPAHGTYHAWVVIPASHMPAILHAITDTARSAAASSSRIPAERRTPAALAGLDAAVDTAARLP